MRACIIVVLASLACDAASGIPLGPRSNFSEVEAATARSECVFPAGTLPGLSIAKDAPLGPQIPIDTIVVLMMENRSFDHMLSQLEGADVAAADATNPDSNGQPVARFHQSEMCFDDTSHSWRGAHTEWDGGKNDGFVVANNPAGARAMGYYTAEDIPFFYGLARTFAVSDHNFAALLSNTEPNRMYLYAATSFGATDNFPWFDPKPTIMETLEAAHVRWKVYSEGALAGIMIFAGSAQPFYHTNFFNLDRFLADVQEGSLPPVVFLDAELANENGSGDDLHPPGDVQNGDRFIARVVDAMIHGPQWPRSALFITFDEWGGLYDHVPPPKACPPDDIPPMLGAGDPAGGFDRYGFRVPLIVVSPYAKPHYVSHRVSDHTSILRFIEARFLLPALTRRDANADPLFDLFDFSAPALLNPPALPAAALDQARLNDCAVRFP